MGRLFQKERLLPLVHTRSTVMRHDILMVTNFMVSGSQGWGPKMVEVLRISWSGRRLTMFLSAMENMHGKCWPAWASPNPEWHLPVNGSPGRFFAAIEMKTMMAHLILNYDIKMEKEGVRPPNGMNFLSCPPDVTARVMFRRRRWWIWSHTLENSRSLMCVDYLWLDIKTFVMFLVSYLFSVRQKAFYTRLL